MAACCRDCGFGHKVSKVTPSVGPAMLLLVLPKCPMCLAAWLTMATGMSFSAESATWVRVGLALLLGTAVAHLAWRFLQMRRRAGQIADDVVKQS